MASDVLAALDLDKESMAGTIFLIKEISGSESHFVNSCLIAKQLKEQGAVCLVTIHNAFQHYHNIGLKLGYNLEKLKEVEIVKSVDCLEIICDTLVQPEDKKTGFTNNKMSIEDLCKIIEDSVLCLLSKHSSACLIIDDLTGLLELGYTLYEVNTFVQQCKSLVANDKSSFVVGVHVISETDPSHILSGLVSHMSDVICEVSGFKTGRSRDVSGTISVLRPWNNVCNSLVKLNNYHYKLFDRGIKVFAAGTQQ